MTKSAIIKQEILALLGDKNKHSVQEMKEYLNSRQIGEYTEGQFAGVLNNLQKNNLICKAERGIYSLIEKNDNGLKKCFVVSPIGEDGSDIRRNADQLFNHIIKPVCEKCGFKAIRIDHENTPDSITQGILDSLFKYDLVIADLTGHNPNVFFEIGYRASIGKPIIHLKRKGESIPFDVSSIRTFDYDLTDLDVVAETRERLEKAILSFIYEDDLDEIEEFDGGESNKIMSLLNDIIYKLDILSEDIRKKDQESIKAVIEAYNGMQPVNESMETQMLKILLPELLRNPKAADSLIKISEKFQK
ncbi:nucleoside 2-deoxyribosyltransferase [Faecalimonas umbilicata]|nr:nucleoside 2-deoxyribosyltransferase [Faecalimonas umbilicata]